MWHGKDVAAKRRTQLIRSRRLSGVVIPVVLASTQLRHPKSVRRTAVAAESTKTRQSSTTTTRRETIAAAKFPTHVKGIMKVAVAGVVSIVDVVDLIDGRRYLRQLGRMEWMWLSSVATSHLDHRRHGCTVFVGIVVGKLAKGTRA